MLIILCGIVIEVSSWQKKNAESPILITEYSFSSYVTFDGITTLPVYLLFPCVTSASLVSFTKL